MTPRRVAATSRTAPPADEDRPDLEDLDRVRVFLRPWVLLLLKEEATHGYELIKRLHSVGFEGVDRSVYRILAALERSGSIAATWDTPDAGPARKVYGLTLRGEDDLDRSAVVVENVARLLTTVVRRHQAAATPAPAEGRRRARRRR